MGSTRLKREEKPVSPLLIWEKGTNERDRNQLVDSPVMAKGSAMRELSKTEQGRKKSPCHYCEKRAGGTNERDRNQLADTHTDEKLSCNGVSL